MGKVNDIKAYWREVASKAGLDDDSIKQVETAFGNDKALKAFTDNFKPLPDYSADLDNVRARAVSETDQKYKDWHEQEKVKFNEYTAGLDKLAKYESLYGPIDLTDPNLAANLNRGGLNMTKDDIDKLVEAKIEARVNSVISSRDAAYLEFRDADHDHMAKFKRPLDRVAFEKAWKENPALGGSLYQAYQNYVRPEVEKLQTAEVEARIKAAREEGIRDGYSRRALPTDHASQTFSPMFDKDPKVASMSENDQDRHSRESFFEGLREGNKQPA